MKRKFISALIVVCLIASWGCAKQTSGTDEFALDVALPPQNTATDNSVKAPLQETNISEVDKQTLVAGEANTSTTMSSNTSSNSATDGPRKGEPAELAELLEMKATFSRDDTAVRQMRPSAIREAAQLVAIQSAMVWRYAQLVAATEQYAPIMDTAFNFSPLLMTQGDALIMPPVLTRGGAAMRIEAPETATTSKASYELLEAAKYVSVPPSWRGYLMVNTFPQPEKPNPAVMPKNSKERKIWREAVRENWVLGVEQADELYLDNVSRMVRDFRGIMLYHLLTAQHLLSQVFTASTDLGIRQNDNKLYLGQYVYRITAPSMFKIPAPEKASPTAKAKRSKSKSKRK